MSFSHWHATGAAFLAGLLLVILTGCAGSGHAGSEEVQAFQAMMEARPTTMNPTNYDTVYPEDQVDMPPEIEGGMDAFYERALENRPPEDLIKAKEGETTIFLIVSPEGEPTNVAILDATYPALGESVRSVVLNSSFTPGRHNDDPVPVAHTLDVAVVSFVSR